MSPEVENLTPSFVTLMSTLSPMVARSLRHIRQQATAGSGNLQGCQQEHACMHMHVHTATAVSRSTRTCTCMRILPQLCPVLNSYLGMLQYPAKSCWLAGLRKS
jgi:hypothetical protein